jgi:hypothetical protein
MWLPSHRFPFSAISSTSVDLDAKVANGTFDAQMAE